MLGGLAASHHAGILHRDIKPANVLLAEDGTARLADFGIAKSIEGGDATATGIVLGTAAYLAPERLAGRAATAQSDLYAVGAVLYEALAGRKPFTAETPLAMLRAIDRHAPPPLRDLRPELEPRSRPPWSGPWPPTRATGSPPPGRWPTPSGRRAGGRVMDPRPRRPRRLWR